MRAGLFVGQAVAGVAAGFDEVDLALLIDDERDAVDEHGSL